MVKGTKKKVKKIYEVCKRTTRILGVISIYTQLSSRSCEPVRFSFSQTLGSRVRFAEVGLGVEDLGTGNSIGFASADGDSYCGGGGGGGVAARYECSLLLVYCRYNGGGVGILGGSTEGAVDVEDCLRLTVGDAEDLGDLEEWREEARLKVGLRIMNAEGLVS